MKTYTSRQEIAVYFAECWKKAKPEVTYIDGKASTLKMLAVDEKMFYQILACIITQPATIQN